MTEVLGRYEILEAIGEGGFAIVYRGRDTLLDRQVALKELRPMLLQDKEWVKRFQREAQTIAQLDHPYIVPIYDVYETDQRLFIVMRLVDGTSLEELLRRQGQLPWPNVVETMTAITEGLAFAHDRNILHRDMKPANIMIDAERGAMLSDFGLAKILGRHSVSMTESGSIVGTPHYIAPEIWDGKSTSPQSDIYALGCILYEMVTGEKVIKGETPPAVMMAHFKPLELPQRWPDQVPAGITTVLQTALARDPQQRYPDATAMGRAILALSAAGLEPAVSGSPPSASIQTSARPVAEPAAPAPVQSGHDIPTQQMPLESPVPPPEEAARQFVSSSTPAPVPAARQQRGCLTKTFLLGLAMLVVIGVGLASFCAAVGGSLGSNADQPFEYVANLAANNVQIGDTVTETINIPVPQNAESGNLEMEIATGNLYLTSNPTQQAWLSGTVSYNVEQLRPQIVTSGRNARLGHESAMGDTIILAIYDFVNNTVESRWNLTIGNAPMALSLAAGTVDSQIEFGTISLVDLTIRQIAVSNLDLSFNEPNQVSMETFQIDAGPVRRMVLTDLANSRANSISINSSGGEYSLDFTGQLQNDMTVDISGSDSTFSLTIPEGLSARVEIVGDRQTIDASTEWQPDGPNYILPGSSDFEITIAVALENGSIKLRNR